MTESPSSDAPPDDDAPPPRRALTRRALAVGAVLAALYALLVPWNDYYLGNSFLYNNYLPPIVTLTLLLLALVINPLLGARRLERGELVVVAVLLLGLGGTVSNGLIRYWPSAIAGTARAFAEQPKLATLRVPLSADERRALAADLDAVSAAEIGRSDGDGDGRWSLEEFAGAPAQFAHADADGDGSIDVAEWSALRLARDPGLLPDWRWAVDPALYLGVPAAGPVASDDPEHRHLVDGYLDRLAPADQRAVVAHRARVDWRAADGSVHRGVLALSGRERERALRRDLDFLDLDDPQTGFPLRGMRAGETRALPEGGSVTVLAIQPPGVPWDAWLPRLAAWAPLLLGGLLALVALAGLVRRQWIENERLPYPIAAATHALLEDPPRGRRLAALYRSPAFWAGFAVAGLIALWKGLHHYGVLPIDIATSLSLKETFTGLPWELMPDYSAVFTWQVFFSIVAITFFLPLETSFSLWFFFLAQNVFAMLLRLGGVPVEKAQISDAGAGGMLMLCLLVLWIGRRSYLAALRAAFRRRLPPELAEARTWVWALFAGSGLMVAFFLAHGAPLGPSVLIVLLFLASMLVFARIVAEAGVPLLQFPSHAFLNQIFFSLVGFQLPIIALVPLSLLGTTLAADPRESLLPYAVNAGYLGHRAGLPPRRLHLLILAAALLGALLGGYAMVANGYAAQSTDDWGVAQVSNERNLGLLADGVRNVELGGESGGAGLGYAVGAGVVALVGGLRLAWPAWPLHPIGFVTATAWPTRWIWFCFLLGWLGKLLVLRYGGSALYARLKPAAIGLIAGEAAGLGVFLIAKIIGDALGAELPPFSILPG